MTDAYCPVCGANRSHRVRTVEWRNLGGSYEVLKLAAKILERPNVPRSTLQLWRRPTTDPPFPKPKKLRMGEVWDLAAVEAWLRAPKYVGDAKKPKTLEERTREMRALTESVQEHNERIHGQEER